jgi:hypothetical protein
MHTHALANDLLLLSFFNSLSDRFRWITVSLFSPFLVQQRD